MKKIIITLVSTLTGAAIGASAVAKITEDETNKARNLSDKHLALFLLMNQWVKVKQEGKSIASYLKEKGYNRIAIYGMSYVGETLISELENTDIEIAYGIDKNAEGIFADIDVFTVDDILVPVDAVVVTAITFYDEIVEMLSDKIDCPILSLEDVLYEIE